MTPSSFFSQIEHRFYDQQQRQIPCLWNTFVLSFKDGSIPLQPTKFCPLFIQPGQVAMFTFPLPPQSNLYFTQSLPASCLVITGHCYKAQQKFRRQVQVTVDAEFPVLKLFHATSTLRVCVSNYIDTVRRALLHSTFILHELPLALQAIARRDRTPWRTTTRT